MTTSKPTIGSSIVEYIDRHSSSVVDQSSISENRPNLHPTSALLAAAVHASETSLDSPWKSRRMLLRGPPQSGRSSLAMEMACAIAGASDPPCCGECGGVGENSCKCVAVGLLVNAKKSKEALFPAHCSRHVSVEGSDDLESKLRAIDREHQPLSWNAEALGRIHVEHITSLHGLLEYLLSLQAKPTMEQPWGAIIIDDIDSFIQHENGSDDRGVKSLKELMNITRILVVLADTANTLYRIHPSITVIATMDSAIGLPSNADLMLKKWFPSIVSLVSSPKPFTDIGDDGDSMESSWRAELTLVDNTTPSASFPYNMVRKVDGSLRILWTSMPSTDWEASGHTQAPVGSGKL